MRTTCIAIGSLDGIIAVLNGPVGNGEPSDVLLQHQCIIGALSNAGIGTDEYDILEFDSTGMTDEEIADAIKKCSRYPFYKQLPQIIEGHENLLYPTYKARTFAVTAGNRMLLENYGLCRLQYYSNGDGDLYLRHWHGAER